jgi:hypothetical protein
MIRGTFVEANLEVYHTLDSGRAAQKLQRFITDLSKMNMWEPPTFQAPANHSLGDVHC